MPNLPRRIFGLSRVWTLTSIVIDRLFDGLTVIALLGIGVFLSIRTSQTTGILIDVLLTGGSLLGMISLAAFFLSGSAIRQILSRFSILLTKMERVLSRPDRNVGVFFNLEMSVWLGRAARMDETAPAFRPSVREPARREP